MSWSRVAVSAAGERVLELRNGDRAPEGYEIRRILATREEPTGTGTSTRTVYIVAAAPVPVAGREERQ